MKKIIPFFLLILLLASCQKDPDMSKLDNDFVVYTNHDSKTDFKSFTTFYIPDSVLVIGNSEKPQQLKQTISLPQLSVTWKAVVTLAQWTKKQQIWVCRFLLLKM